MSEDAGRRSVDADEYSSLREAVAEAVAEQSDADSGLEDEFDLAALDGLFRSGARPQTSAELRTNELQVRIWGDGSVEVRSLES